MKKAEKIFRKSIVFTIGKVLTLCGIAITFAACYGVYEPDYPTPEYWGSAKKENCDLQEDETKNQAPIQTTEVEEQEYAHKK